MWDNVRARELGLFLIKIKSFGKMIMAEVFWKNVLSLSLTHSHHIQYQVYLYGEKRKKEKGLDSHSSNHPHTQAFLSKVIWIIHRERSCCCCCCCCRHITTTRSTAHAWMYMRSSAARQPHARHPSPPPPPSTSSTTPPSHSPSPSQSFNERQHCQPCSRLHPPAQLLCHPIPDSRRPLSHPFVSGRAELSVRDYRPTRKALSPPPHTHSLFSEIVTRGKYQTT